MSETTVKMFHLYRIGPPATKSGVVNVMDFEKVTSLIGRNRGKVDFVLDSSNHVASQYISRLHSRVVRQENNSHRLFDDSLNGVFINNTKIMGSVVLQEGDIVTFGHPYGVRLKPGVWARQPDSEYQFIFEKCNCDKTEVPKSTILEDRVNTHPSVFKKPQQIASKTSASHNDTKIKSSPTITNNQAVKPCVSPAPSNPSSKDNLSIQPSKQSSVLYDKPETNPLPSNTLYGYSCGNDDSTATNISSKTSTFKKDVEENGSNLETFGPMRDLKENVAIEEASSIINKCMTTIAGMTKALVNSSSSDYSRSDSMSKYGCASTSYHIKETEERNKLLQQNVEFDSCKSNESILDETKVYDDSINEMQNSSCNGNSYYEKKAVQDDKDIMSTSDKTFKTLQSETKEIDSFVSFTTSTCDLHLSSSTSTSLPESLSASAVLSSSTVLHSLMIPISTSTSTSLSVTSHPISSASALSTEKSSSNMPAFTSPLTSSTSALKDDISSTPSTHSTPTLEQSPSFITSASSNLKSGINFENNSFQKENTDVTNSNTMSSIGISLPSVSHSENNEGSKVVCNIDPLKEGGVEDGNILREATYGDEKNTGQDKSSTELKVDETVIKGNADLNSSSLTFQARNNIVVNEKEINSSLRAGFEKTRSGKSAVLNSHNDQFENVPSTSSAYVGCMTRSRKRKQKKVCPCCGDDNAPKNKQSSSSVPSTPDSNSKSKKRQKVLLDSGQNSKDGTDVSSLRNIVDDSDVVYLLSESNGVICISDDEDDATINKKAKYVNDEGLDPVVRHEVCITIDEEISTKNGENVSDLHLGENDITLAKTGLNSTDNNAIIDKFDSSGSERESNFAINVNVANTEPDVSAQRASYMDLIQEKTSAEVSMIARDDSEMKEVTEDLVLDSLIPNLKIPDGIETLTVVNPKIESVNYQNKPTKGEPNFIQHEQKEENQTHLGHGTAQDLENNHRMKDEVISHFKSENEVLFSEERTGQKTGPGFVSVDLENECAEEKSNEHLRVDVNDLKLPNDESDFNAKRERNNSIYEEDSTTVSGLGCGNLPEANITPRVQKENKSVSSQDDKTDSGGDVDQKPKIEYDGLRNSDDAEEFDDNVNDINLEIEKNVDSSKFGYNAANSCNDSSGVKQEKLCDVTFQTYGINNASQRQNKVDVMKQSRQNAGLETQSIGNSVTPKVKNDDFEISPRKQNILDTIPELVNSDNITSSELQNNDNDVASKTQNDDDNAKSQSLSDDHDITTIIQNKHEASEMQGDDSEFIPNLLTEEHGISKLLSKDVPQKLQSVNENFTISITSNNNDMTSQVRDDFTPQRQDDAMSQTKDDITSQKGDDDITQLQDVAPQLQDNVTEQIQEKAPQQNENEITPQIRCNVTRQLEDDVRQQMQDDVILQRQDFVTPLIQDDDMKQMENYVIPQIQDDIAPQMEDDVTKQIELDITPQMQDNVRPLIQDDVMKQNEDDETSRIQDDVTKQMEDVTPQIQEDITNEMEYDVTPQMQSDVTPFIQDDITEQMQDNVASQMTDDENVIPQKQDNVTTQKEEGDTTQILDDIKLQLTPQMKGVLPQLQDNNVTIQMEDDTQQIKDNIKSQQGDGVSPRIQNGDTPQMDEVTKPQIRNDEMSQTQDDITLEVKEVTIQIQSGITRQMKDHVIPQLKDDDVTSQIQDDVTPQIQGIAPQMESHIIPRMIVGKTMIKTSRMQENVTAQIEDDIKSQRQDDIHTQLKDAELAQMENDVTSQLQDDDRTQIKDTEIAQMENAITPHIQDDVTTQMEDFSEEDVKTQMTDDVTQEKQDGDTSPLVVDKDMPQSNDAANLHIQESAIIPRTGDNDDTPISQEDEVTKQTREDCVTPQTQNNEDTPQRENVASQIDEDGTPQIQDIVPQMEDEFTSQMRGAFTPRMQDITMQNTEREHIEDITPHIQDDVATQMEAFSSPQMHNIAPQMEDDCKTQMTDNVTQQNQDTIAHIDVSHHLQNANLQMQDYVTTQMEDDVRPQIQDDTSSPWQDDKDTPKFKDDNVTLHKQEDAFTAQTEDSDDITTSQEVKVSQQMGEDCDMPQVQINENTSQMDFNPFTTHLKENVLSQTKSDVEENVCSQTKIDVAIQQIQKNDVTQLIHNDGASPNVQNEDATDEIQNHFRSYVQDNCFDDCDVTVSMSRDITADDNLDNKESKSCDSEQPENFTDTTFVTSTPADGTTTQGHVVLNKQISPVTKNNITADKDFSLDCEQSIVSLPSLTTLSNESGLTKVFFTDEKESSHVNLNGNLEVLRNLSKIDDNERGNRNLENERENEITCHLESQDVREGKKGMELSKSVSLDVESIHGAQFSILENLSDKNSVSSSEAAGPKMLDCVDCKSQRSKEQQKSIKDGTEEEELESNVKTEFYTREHCSTLLKLAETNHDCMTNDSDVGSQAAGLLYSESQEFGVLGNGNNQVEISRSFDDESENSQTDEMPSEINVENNENESNNLNLPDNEHEKKKDVLIDSEPQEFGLEITSDTWTKDESGTGNEGDGLLDSESQDFGLELTDDDVDSPTRDDSERRKESDDRLVYSESQEFGLELTDDGGVSTRDDSETDNERDGLLDSESQEFGLELTDDCGISKRDDSGTKKEEDGLLDSESQEFGLEGEVDENEILENKKNSERKNAEVYEITEQGELCLDSLESLRSRITDKKNGNRYTMETGALPISSENCDNKNDFCIDTENGNNATELSDLQQGHSIEAKCQITEFSEVQKVDSAKEQKIVSKSQNIDVNDELELSRSEIDSDIENSMSDSSQANQVLSQKDDDFVTIKMSSTHKDSLISTNEVASIARSGLVETENVCVTNGVSVITSSKLSHGSGEIKDESIDTCKEINGEKRPNVDVSVVCGGDAVKFGNEPEEATQDIEQESLDPCKQYCSEEGPCIAVSESCEDVALKGDTGLEAIQEINKQSLDICKEYQNGDRTGVDIIKSTTQTSIIQWNQSSPEDSSPEQLMFVSNSSPGKSVFKMPISLSPISNDQQQNVSKYNHSTEGCSFHSEDIESFCNSSCSDDDNQPRSQVSDFKEEEDFHLCWSQTETGSSGHISVECSEEDHVANDSSTSLHQDGVEGYGLKPNSTFGPGSNSNNREDIPETIVKEFETEKPRAMTFGESKTQLNMDSKALDIFQEKETSIRKIIESVNIEELGDGCEDSSGKDNPGVNRQIRMNDKNKKFNSNDKDNVETDYDFHYVKIVGSKGCDDEELSQEASVCSKNCSADELCHVKSCIEDNGENSNDVRDGISLENANIEKRIVVECEKDNIDYTRETEQIVFSDDESDKHRNVDEIENLAENQKTLINKIKYKSNNNGDRANLKHEKIVCNETSTTVNEIVNYSDTVHEKSYNKSCDRIETNEENKVNYSSQISADNVAEDICNGKEQSYNESNLDEKKAEESSTFLGNTTTKRCNDQNDSLEYEFISTKRVKFDFDSQEFVADSPILPLVTAIREEEDSNFHVDLFPALNSNSDKFVNQSKKRKVDHPSLCEEQTNIEFSNGENRNKKICVKKISNSASDSSSIKLKWTPIQPQPEFEHVLSESKSALLPQISTLSKDKGIFGSHPDSIVTNENCTESYSPTSENESLEICCKATFLKGEKCENYKEKLNDDVKFLGTSDESSLSFIYDTMTMSPVIENQDIHLNGNTSTSNPCLDVTKGEFKESVPNSPEVCGNENANIPGKSIAVETFGMKTSSSSSAQPISLPSPSHSESSYSMTVSSKAMEQDVEESNSTMDSTPPEKRRAKRESLYTAVIQELQRMNKDIRMFLSKDKPNVDQAIEVLEDLQDTPINSTALAKFPQIMETLNKCRRYKQSEDVRQLSQRIYDRFKTILL